MLLQDQQNQITKLHTAYQVLADEHALFLEAADSQFNMRLHKRRFDRTPGLSHVIGMTYP